MNKRVDIYLSDEEIKFLRWLAEYDNTEDNKNCCGTNKWTVSKEISCLASMKINETLNYYRQEGYYNG